MKNKELRVWKKVHEADIDSIVYELKGVLEAPALIILSGDVGAGKTTFIKRFVSLLSNNKASETQSPTYSLIQEVGEIVHADFYRLKDRNELVHLEIPLYSEGKQFFLVEWGRPYFAELKKLIDGDYKFFEIVITINDVVGDKIQETEADKIIPSRNFHLFSIADY